MSSVIELFRCDECRTIHEDEDDAAECCRPTVSSIFKCETCSEHHYSLKDALDCCDGFECPACNISHATKDDAEECCGMTIIDRPSPKELEKHGQQRLPL